VQSAAAAASWMALSWSTTDPRGVNGLACVNVGGGGGGGPSPAHLCSLALRQGLSARVLASSRAKQRVSETGHSVQTLLTTYVSVIEELRGEPRQSAETLIRSARGPQMDRETAVGGEK
jgi:hypothetical protein